MGNPVLEMHNIHKSFAGVAAVKGASLFLEQGDVMALVGENGAGKSTLMRILTGIYQMDGGEILFRGRQVNFKNAKESSNAGIQIIHQEFNLFPNLTVAENIFLDNPSTVHNGLVDWDLARRKSRELIASIGGEIDVDDKVSSLTVQNQQIVEIVKALSTDAEVLIMDEPTSALPDNEVQNLFRTINRLKERGVAIIYVSHRLNEIFAICNSITVLRDGAAVARKSIEDSTQQEIISLMVGKDVEKLYPKIEGNHGDIVLSVRNLKDNKNVVRDASFDLYAGEILGLYGLLGSGADECPKLIFGLGKAVGGSVSVMGEPLSKLNVSTAIRRRIAYVPADRRREGIISQLSVKINLTLAIIKRISGKLIIKREEENKTVAEYIEKLHIKCAGEDQKVNYLSGGNQQKIVISKWLATNPEVLMLNDPTRGVDVGAKSEIYGIISRLAAEGMGVLITSSDIDEILGMSDRILVFNKGKIVREVARAEATMPSLLAAAVSSSGGE